MEEIEEAAKASKATYNTPLTPKGNLVFLHIEMENEFYNELVKEELSTTATPVNSAPCVCPTSSSSAQTSCSAGSVNTNASNVVTIPVPIIATEGIYSYVAIKGSLHDRSCTVFGLNDIEVQAISKRFENAVKPVVNGVMISISPIAMINTLAQLSYKVVSSCGEAEICWTLQREI